MRRLLRLPIWGLMVIIASVAVLLLVVKASWPDWTARYSNWQRNRAIHAQLDRSVALRHPSGIALVSLLDTVMRSTRCKEFPKGVPIYVDEIALQSAGATLNSPVSIDTQGDKLSTSLRAALDQHGLDYHVHDGLVEVISQGSVP